MSVLASFLPAIKTKHHVSVSNLLFFKYCPSLLRVSLLPLETRMLDTLLHCLHNLAARKIVCFMTVNFGTREDKCLRDLPNVLFAVAITYSRNSQDLVAMSQE